MDYYGLLFLYYLKGLSGKSVLRLFFNIEAGGTEQLLPENTSTPTTTPLLADIQYPDGLRTDQYFTYRETPTTVSNKARIKTIKGNTLVWNQLVQNGNFADDSLWRVPNGTASVSNNVLTATATGANLQILSSSYYTFTQGHKIYISCWVKASVAKNDVRLRISQDSPLANVQYISKNLDANVRTNISGIITAESNTVNSRFSVFIQNSANGEVYTVDSFVAFDLTKMGLDSITDPSEFTSLFNLPYYAYNQGSLLSFNGNGIKTVGKNIFSTEGNTWYKNNVGEWNSTYDTSSTRIRSMGFPCKKGTYTISGFPTSNNISLLSVICYDINHNYLGNATRNGNTSVISFDECEYIALLFSGINFDSSTNALFKNADIQVEHGASASSFEPYIENTLSLPISTYFPSGMKSAGTVYDELTPTKAVTRIGAVDLGSLEWTYSSPFQRFSSSGISTEVLTPSSNVRVGNILSSIYTTTSVSRTVPENRNGDMLIAVATSGNIIIVNESYGADATAFTQAMSGIYLYYELATPTETPITTEDANEALSLLMGKSVSSNNANQLINIITKGE